MRGGRAGLFKVVLMFVSRRAYTAGMAAMFMASGRSRGWRQSAHHDGPQVAGVASRHAAVKGVEAHIL